MRVVTYKSIILSLLCVTAFFAAVARAQDAATPPVAAVEAPAAVQAPAVVQTPMFMDSFLFTPLEIDLISRAIAGKAVKGVAGQLNNNTTSIIPEKRVITVSGVFYRSASDWTVWINGQKIVPGYLLPEIVDISVSRDNVRLEWFDIGLNGIIKIDMRPHQTYDIVTGVLLPG
jgi:hypothetical protein